MSDGKKNYNFWPFKIIIITLCLSFIFGILAEAITSRSSLVACLIIILVFIFIGIIFDIIAVAVTSCDEESFTALSSKKVSGAKISLKLIKNAGKVNSICADVIGDIAGVLSGAAGAEISIRLFSSLPDIQIIIFTTLITSVIAALTVGGKAFGKKYALNNSNKIIERLGKLFKGFEK